MTTAQKKGLSRLRALYTINKYKNDDAILVKIITRTCGHRFDIGQIVYMHCNGWASDSPNFDPSAHNGWYLAPAEYEIVSDHTQEDIYNLPSKSIACGYLEF